MIIIVFRNLTNHKIVQLLVLKAQNIDQIMVFISFYKSFYCELLLHNSTSDKNQKNMT